MPRPTVLTPDLQKRICDLLSAGNFVDTAVRAVGISPATHYSWMEKGGAAKSGKHHDYVEAVQDALAKAEAAAVTRIQIAAKKDWRANAWYLERAFPERWKLAVGKRSQDEDLDPPAPAPAPAPTGEPAGENVVPIGSAGGHRGHPGTDQAAL